MADISYFESRSGKITGSAEEVFTFVTDLRNFERFVQKNMITNWNADRESCSFRVSIVGDVGLYITEKESCKRVVYNGDALKKNDFTLVLHLSGVENNTTNVKISLNADLNPMLKIMAAKPVEQFLEMLISEIEQFRDWRDIKG